MTDETACVRAYSRALFGAARVTAAIPAVQRDLAAVLDALAESAELQRWITRRVLSTPARRTAEARQRLGSLVSPATLRLLDRMAAWNHLHLLPAVARRFDDAVRRAEGRRTAHVVSAQTPDASTLSAIRARFTPGSTGLDIDLRIDPGLLAGLTVRLDDRLFDASLAGRLARLRQALANPGRAPSAASAPA